MRKMSQARKDESKKADAQKGAEKPPTEVFDSSKYDAMNDMTKGASANQLPDMQATMDVQTQEPLKSKDIPNESLTSPASTSGARVNPMVPEERARTIREIKEDATPMPEVESHGRQADENAGLLETKDYGYFMPDWGAAMHQYVQMANMGLELYSMFAKNSLEVMGSWWRTYQRIWFGSSEE